MELSERLLPHSGYIYQVRLNVYHALYAGRANMIILPALIWFVIYIRQVENESEVADIFYVMAMRPTQAHQITKWCRKKLKKLKNLNKIRWKHFTFVGKVLF